MPARIFVSCGQRPGPEKVFCDALKAWLEAQGFGVYVAISIHSILDLNTGIINALKCSDYYLFINFARERVIDAVGNETIRGSVYTNQELAIAIGMNIEHCLFINQRGVQPEGIHRYLVSNIPEFENPNNLLPIVQTAVVGAGWTSNYSRHLVVSQLRWGNVVKYGDHTGQRLVRVLHGAFKNSRRDEAAYGVIARLIRNGPNNGAVIPSLDQSQLKASGHVGYEHTIFPESEVAFDLLALQVGAPGTVYLNSGMDAHPRTAIVTIPGMHRFTFEVMAQKFPKLEFTIDVNVMDGANIPPAPLRI